MTQATQIARLAMILAGGTAMAACAPVPQLGARPEPIAASAVASTESLRGGTPDTRIDAWPAQQWWTAYGDAQLDALMQEAIAGAPDLKAAAARLRQAEGLSRQAGAALLPSIDARAGATYLEQSDNMGIPPGFAPEGWQGQLSLGFSLDLDLWGKNRATLAAAKAEEQAARYEVEQARLVLTTSLAASYADLARLHAQRDVLTATLTNRTETLRLVSGRVQAGLDNNAALRQAQSRVAAARAEIAATDEAIALTRNAIAALLGAGPDRALAITRPAVALGDVRGIPADASIALVGRRPDIASARAGVEATGRRIDAARAAFYPDINLSGLIGLQALGFGNLIESGSTYGNVGPALTLPVFRGGSLSGQYRSARGRYDEAVARYDGTVVQALREVADTLASRRMLTVRLGETRRALGDAEAAQALARTRYTSGLSTYIDVLTAEENVLQLRRQVADLQARALTLDIAMVRSLGGGFSVPA